MKKIIYIFTFLIQFGIAQIQENFPPGIHLEPIQNIFLTRTVFPIFETESSRVDFQYIIPQNFLIYTRYTDTSYKAQCEITLEIKSKNTNRTEVRKIQIREFFLNEPPKDENSYFKGIFSFNLKNGKYQIIFEVRDKESSRIFVDNKKEFEIPEVNNNISDLFFLQYCDTLSLISSRIYNMAYGEAIPFNSSFIAYVELNSNYFQNLNPVIELFEIIENQKNKIITDQNFKLMKSYKLVPLVDSLYYSFERDEKYTGLLIFFPYKSLRIGDYELVLKLQQDKEPIKRNFQIKWINMPKSLKNFRLAIDLLEYIATPEEIREMKVLNPKSVKEKFETFWKKLDPTPETVYNEAMAEYYKRADYANEQFGTLKGDLGAKTDRGKIYILYGEPANIERIILPRTTPKEIWTYKNLSKKFIFEDKNFDGSYKLIRIETL